VPDAEALALHAALAARLPGYLVPKLVREIAGQPGKTPLHAGAGPSRPRDVVALARLPHASPRKAIGKVTALRLMLLDDQDNEAEGIICSLRNAGIAVRPLRPESLDDLAQMLAQQPVDLVLAEHASTGLPFNEVALVVGGCGRDVPLLAVLDGVTDEILDGVQALGAQGVALRGR